MRIRLHRRVNGNTVLPPNQDSKPITPAADPKPIAPAAASARSVVIPISAPPAVNQVPLNTTPTDSTHRASPPASATNSPPPVATTLPHPSSAPLAAGPVTASAPPPANTPASSPPLSSNAVRAPTNSVSTGLASTGTAVQSNTPETHLGLYADSEHHTSTGVIVAAGLSGVAITLMFLILMRFFVKRLLNKRPKIQPVQECSVNIPPPACAFLDHPKNQEMGGVGASPSAMMNRRVSNNSVRSDASFMKPQEQYLNNSFDHSHYDPNLQTNYAAGFHQRPPMEALYPTETLFVQPKSWDGSRPTLPSGRPYYQY